MGSWWLPLAWAMQASLLRSESLNASPLRRAGNITLDKARSQDKMDGVMSLNCAVAEWMPRTAADPNEIPDDYQIRTL